MIRKTIEIATPGTRLTIANNQLVIDRPDTPKATLPVEDLGVVIVDSNQTTYSHSVFTRLLDAGATIVFSGTNHLPAGLLLPLDAHHAQTERHLAQIEASLPTRKQLWRTLVAAKLYQQGRVLERFIGNDAGLGEMAKRVRSGDPENLEAQGAQRYWPKLFGKDFRRRREGAAPNEVLNYGYAVIRAATARAIVAAGLIPTLGLHHHNRSNPFCLADDLIEPYRPLVDWRVKLLVEEGVEPIAIDNRQVRAAMLSLLNETILISGKRSPLFLAFHTSAASLCRALTGKERELALPESLPLDLMADADADD